MNEQRFQMFWLYNLECHNFKVEKRVTNNNIMIDLLFPFVFQLRLVINPHSAVRDSLVLEAKLNNLSVEEEEEEKGPQKDKQPQKNQDEVKTSQDKKYECPHCGAKYVQYGRLQNHIKAKHAVEGVELELIKCDKCPGRFKTVKKLNRHKKIHENE